MEIIAGYKKTEYKDLRVVMNNYFKQGNKTLPELAFHTKQKGIINIRSAFRFDVQKISDKLLTSIFQSLDLDAFIVWHNGERMYFIPANVSITEIQ